MRVLLTTAHMAVGGAERVVVELAEGCRTRGDEVAVAAAPGPLDSELERLDVERFDLAETGRSVARTASLAPTLARRLRAFRPDVVHAHNVKAAAVAGVAARLASPRRRPPVLVTFHGVRPDEMSPAARLLRLADHTVCVSHDLANALVGAGLPLERTTVIENAVPVGGALSERRRREIDAELGLNGSPLVCAVGRLVPQKAHHRYVDAAALVAAQEPRARFVILGEGPLRGELAAQIERLDLGDRVRLAGVRADAREVMARADLVAFSSDWEGLSLVALEALSAGTPVVSTDVAGMRDLLAGGAGALTSAFTAEALAEDLLALLRDCDRRRAMGERGRDLIARRFSLDRMVEAYRARYELLAR